MMLTNAMMATMMYKLTLEVPASSTSAWARVPLPLEAKFQLNWLNVILNILLLVLPAGVATGSGVDEGWGLTIGAGGDGAAATEDSLTSNFTGITLKSTFLFLKKSFYFVIGIILFTCGSMLSLPLVTTNLCVWSLSHLAIFLICRVALYLIINYYINRFQFFAHKVRKSILCRIDSRVVPNFLDRLRPEPLLGVSRT